MNISLVILKNGTYLVAQTDELEFEPKCHMTKPMLVSGIKKVVLTSWPSYTNDEHILLRSDDLLTVCDPTEEVLTAYMKKCDIKLSDLNRATEPAILTDDTPQPTYQEEDEDDYEPNYVEEF